VEAKILLAFVSALIGGLVAHVLSVLREKQTHHRDQLVEFAQRLGVAQLLGTRLAFALDEGDDTRFNELRWQVGEQIYPLLVYGAVHRFHTTELRDAYQTLQERLVALQWWKETPHPETIDPKGPLHYWQQGDIGTSLFKGLEKEFEHVL